MSKTNAGALAFRDGISYEMNPHVPGGPEVAQLCRLSEWPLAAQEWHLGWRDEAAAQADAAEKIRLAAVAETKS